MTTVSIRLRRDTAANWASADPILAAGQPGYDTTNAILKIGDGSTAWSSLPQVSAVASLPDADYGDITVTGSGTALTIDNDVVTFAKMQNIATARILGRTTASSGDVEEIRPGPGIIMSGGVAIGSGPVPVNSVGDTTPPGSPADGDIYCLGASPTGAWSGQGGKIAFYNSSSWVFLTPETQMLVRAKDESADYRWSGSAWAAVAAGGGSGFGRADVPPVSTSFTWQNQGGASVADYDFGMTMTVPYAAGVQTRSLLEAVPSAPYRRRVRLGFHPMRTDVLCGIVLREGGSGKLIVMGVQGSTTVCSTYFNWYNSDTSFNSAKGTSLPFPMGPSVWLSLYNDNTNHIFQISPDGESWVTLYSEAKGAFITPTQIGMHGINAGSSSYDAKITFFSWE